MDSLDDGVASVAFGDVEETPLAAFRAFLAELPRAVDFGERSAAGGTIDTSDPRAIADAAVAFQEEQRAKGLVVSADRAVRHVMKESR